MELMVYGFINSSILVLFSIGFALVFGVSRIPNFAHGALYIFTGALSWVFLNLLGVGYVASIIISVGITALIGALIYQLILIRIRGMHSSEFIATLAIGFVILEGLRGVGFGRAQFGLPIYVQGSVNILGVPVDWQRIILVMVTIGLTTVLWIFAHYTKAGLGLTAIAQDEPAALMLGINTDIAATMAMSIGSASVGIAALITLPLGSILIESGYDMLIYVLAVCIVGGIGSWIGVIFASFVLGYSQILAIRFIAAHFQIVVAMLAIILILILKPSGLLGKQKELEERV